LLPCTCIIKPKLIHLYQTSSLFPSHLPIVTSDESLPAGALAWPGRWRHTFSFSFFITHQSQTCPISSYMFLQISDCRSGIFHYLMKGSGGLE
jgi:hypothetical protein